MRRRIRAAGVWALGVAYGAAAAGLVLLGGCLLCCSAQRSVGSALLGMLGMVACLVAAGPLAWMSGRLQRRGERAWRRAAGRRRGAQ